MTTPDLSFLDALDPDAPDGVTEDGQRYWNVRCRLPFVAPCPDLGGGFDVTERVARSRTALDLRDDNDGANRALDDDVDPDASAEMQEQDEIDLGDDAVVLQGIASSTSVDFFGTEMSLRALKMMAVQMMAGDGVAYLPRHNRGMAGPMEWDDVIGRTVHAEVVPVEEVAKPFNAAESQFLLRASIRLIPVPDAPFSDLDEAERAAASLIKRAQRGEVIGQSIGGWFTSLQVVQNEEGDVERIIVLGVELDHLAVTRAPANPDSVGLIALRDALRDRLCSRARVLAVGRSVLDQALPVARSLSTFERLHHQVVAVEERDNTVVVGYAPDGSDVAALPDDVARAEFEAVGLSRLDVETRHVISAVGTDNTVVYQYLKAGVDAEDVPDDELIGARIEAEAADEPDEPDESDEPADEMSGVDDVPPVEDGQTATERETHEQIEPMCAKAEVDRDAGEVVVRFSAGASDHAIARALNAAMVGDLGEDVRRVVEAARSLRAAVPFESFPLAERDTEWTWDTDAQDAVLGDPDDPNWERYRRVHAWEDPDADPETKAAYKLPHHAMVDGQVRTVWSGVVAAMAALNGARGGVDIPEADREGVHAHLARHYREFDEEPPELQPLSAIRARPTSGAEAARFDQAVIIAALGRSPTAQDAVDVARSLDSGASAGEHGPQADARGSAPPIPLAAPGGASTETEMTAEELSALLDAKLDPITRRLDALEGSESDEPAKTIEERLAEAEARAAAAEERAAAAEQTVDRLASAPQRVGRAVPAIPSGPTAASEYGGLVSRVRAEAPNARATTAVAEKLVPLVSDEVEGDPGTVRRKLEAGLAALFDAAVADGVITPSQQRARWQ